MNYFGSNAALPFAAFSGGQIYRIQAINIGKYGKYKEVL
jgi:hypothetical protein